jgi:hypothetical protein
VKRLLDEEGCGKLHSMTAAIRAFALAALLIN